mmetsp:Transcript_51452/g.165281  ORF Transcript_51452/g.165281 Transcript_51452/m.165281 type:complete len:247 (-) Transcript_51452:450-1190(-)
MSKLGTFLKYYNHTDMHLVSPIPRSLQREVEFLPNLRCGGFLDFLFTHKVWIARGGSRSVVHRDDAENINCLFAGKKRFALVHPRWRKEMEAHPNQEGPPDRFGFVDARLDPSMPGYGAYFGRLDVDAVDLLKFPGWSEVDWYRADLEAGDCLYIPQGWYHQVRAGPSRTVNTMVWYWRPEHFRGASCGDGGTGRVALRLSDCSFGYLPPGNEPKGERHHRGVRQRLTRCRPTGLHQNHRPTRLEL